MAAIHHPWDVADATTIGSFHVSEHLPLQDAVRTWAAADGSAAIAVVADGHGHHAHFRSDVGATLAADLALASLLHALAVDDVDVDPVEAAVETVAAWRDAVLEHVVDHPLRSDENRRGPLVPYGTTLLAVAVTGTRLVALQIGDGDTVAVRASGEAWRPLREDPRSSDGVHTASLCQPDPIASLRTAVVDLTDEDDPVALAFVATDGLGKARPDLPEWWRAEGAAWQAAISDAGIDGVRRTLPEQVREAARVGGDDTTVAILARTDLRGSRPAVR